ncbi:DNA-binding transcriptional regulator, XRE family [Tenacibaculum sp. MAR_2010_89]|uniref:helix-turn-helix transcriptional regulator n=1 Tax=Tenacibaculum sp. MAR_2010_89 TaxID=1250198 RepID=UPI00089739B2|nr:helix-turn-helix transcriptional regulator [Tenacibaculum sp. MAR_2010_89]SEE59054.1 DNA-binding transcriptional regulator, XRE family [Tenacibaculum sp. MAR_2010_89]
MSNKKNYNRLKVVLTEKKQSSRELAKKLNCSESTVSRWCTNDVQPNLETLYKISQFLNIETRDLISINRNI